MNEYPGKGLLPSNSPWPDRVGGASWMTLAPASSGARPESCCALIPCQASSQPVRLPTVCRVELVGIPASCFHKSSFNYSGATWQLPSGRMSIHLTRPFEPLCSSLPGWRSHDDAVVRSLRVYQLSFPLLRHGRAIKSDMGRRFAEMNWIYYMDKVNSYPTLRKRFLCPGFMRLQL